MASRKDPVARARGRKPAPVKKPFPTGMVAGSSVIVLFLGGILLYSATHVGIGDKSGLKFAESKFPGIVSTRGLTANHIDGKLISYANQDTTPPDGGNHNPTPQSCQVYTEPIANEHAVHSLEHGAVWLTYNPSKVSTADIATLKKLVDGNAFRMMSPYPGLKAPISLQAWGESLMVQKASDPKIADFFKRFTNGPQQQESASCVGTTDNKVTADKAFSGTAAPSGKPAGATATTNPSQTAVPDAPTPTAAATAAPTATATPKK
jgi:hypothetical protein